MSSVSKENVKKLMNDLDDKTQLLTKTKTTSIEEYLWFKNWYKRKKKLRARNFLDFVIEPETSITKNTTAAVFSYTT